MFKIPISLEQNYKIIKHISNFRGVFCYHIPIFPEIPSIKIKLQNPLENSWFYGSVVSLKFHVLFFLLLLVVGSSSFRK